jgi:Domain of unknown function (DUF4296)
MKLFPFLLLACVLMAATCQKKAEQPSLSDEKLAQVMADIYLAESASNGLNGNSRDSLSREYLKQVMEIHGMSTELYEKELLLRAESVERLNGIHQRAMILLGEKETDRINGKEAQ